MISPGAPSEATVLISTVSPWSVAPIERVLPTSVTLGVSRASRPSRERGRCRAVVVRWVYFRPAVDAFQNRRMFELLAATPPFEVRSGVNDLLPPKQPAARRSCFTNRIPIAAPVGHKRG